MTQQHSEHGNSISDSQLVPWQRVAAVSAMVAFSLPTFITGLELYQALTVPDAVLAILIGCLILTVIGAAMGSIGVRTRMSSYLLVRIAFGDRGAALVNLAFAISLIGWFGINIDIFANAVHQLLPSSWQATTPTWIIECIAGLCMLGTTLYGFRAINLLASTLVPVLLVLTIYMYFQASETLAIDAFLQLEKTGSMPLSHGIAAIVGTIIIGAIILPDITRFSRQASGGVHTAFWSYQVVQLVVMLVAGFAAAAMAETEILSLLLALGLGALAFVIVIAGSWVLNSLNLYSAVLSVKSTFSQANEKALTLVLGLFGFIAALFNLLDYFINFLVVLSTIFVPVAGVILIDFFLFQKSQYQANKLADNNHYNIAALLAWAVGAGYASLLILFGLPGISSIEVLDSIALTGLVYWLASKLLHKSPN